MGDVETSSSTTLRKQFAEVLRELTSSKESIQRATKMMVEHIEQSEELFAALMKRLRKTAPKRRISLFYLLDSVCQVSKNKSQKEYRELVSKHLNDIVVLIVPDEGEARDKSFSVVVKVLGIWKERKVIPSDALKRAKKRIDISDQNSNKERQLVCVGMDLDVVQKQMEEDRRENKRSRWEGALRPANDLPEAEFNETWDRFLEEEDLKRTASLPGHRNPLRDPVRGKLNSSAPAISSILPSPPNIRFSLSSPREIPSSSSSSPSPSISRSPTSPLSTSPLYIRTPSELHLNPSTSNNIPHNMPNNISNNIPNNIPSNPPNPNNNNFIYYNNSDRLIGDNRNYQDFADRDYRNDWSGREMGTTFDALRNGEILDNRDMIQRELRERDIREREFRERGLRERDMMEREMREREMRESFRERDMRGDLREFPPIPVHSNGYEVNTSYQPPPLPGPPSVPPQYMGPPPPLPARYNDYEPRHDREPIPPPRFEYPEPPQYRERDGRVDYRDGTMLRGGGRELRDVREYRDIRDLRGLRDVRELREMREQGSYPPPPPPPLSPRSYNHNYNTGPPPIPPPPPPPPGIGYGPPPYGMDSNNNNNMTYNNIYRTAGNGGYYTPSSPPPTSPPRSVYSPTSSMYVHHSPPPPPLPPPRQQQNYEHHQPPGRPARLHRYPNRV